ncbi:MAG TPA: DUF2012 domain-containing protein [Verrucomicrobiae bacterium]|nr:DUF2012 domain-containing protein [Verrucomicrobiae bacterium]
MLRRLLSILPLTILSAAILQGQAFYGSIVGTVNDSSGAALAATTVTLTNVATGDRRAVVTATDGSYRFVNLVPGSYRIEIEHPGFKRYTRDQVDVSVESQVRADIVMQVGDVNQSVEVQAEAPLLQTETANLSQVVGSRAVQELPLNGRNILNLISLAPGVVPQGSSEGSLTGKNVFAAGNYQIGGGTANQSATYYDGVPVNDTYGNIVALTPSADAVTEFRIQTSNNTAEYGRYTGGVMNIASRSGTNEFHGSAYEYFRNKVLNATNFFANKTGAGRAPFSQNQFGASGGGRIIKDKLFFFSSYEGYRQRQGNLFLLTVPTPAIAAGDFSDYRGTNGAVVPIYDPLTTCGQLNNSPCGTGTVQRTQFPGNVIPANRINPVARNLVNFPLYAQPTGPGDPFTHNNNFASNAATGGNNDQGNFRGDWNISAKQRMFARYTRWKSSNLPVDVYGNGQRNGDPFSPEAFTTDQAVLTDTYSLTPTTVLDLRLGFMRWFYQRTPGHLGILPGKTFGLPAYFDQLSALDGVDGVTTLPGIAAGYSTIATGFLAARDNSYSIVPTLTKVHGRHTLKFGGELRRQDVNYFQNNNPSGAFSFDTGFTSQNPANQGSSGAAFASFLLGYPNNSTTVQTSPFTAGSIRYQGYFATDTMQLSQKLTVTLGVRWEIPGVYTERYDRLVTFDPNLPNPILQGRTINGNPINGAFVLVNTPGHPERGLRPEHYDLFAPRVGVAYRLTSKTVIRTGGGIFFIPATVQFPEGPYGNVVNYLNHVMVGTTNNNATPQNTLSDPYPGGFQAPPGRNPIYQQVLLGGNNRAPLEYANYGYTEQWNFSVQHQLTPGLALEGSYAGLHGVHLPQGGFQLDALPSQYLSMGAALNNQVDNPLYGLIQNGPLSQPKVQQGLLLMPFPQYTSLPDPGGYRGNSIYHSLQVKAEKRFSDGGSLLAAYTFSKVISDVETLTTWLDSANGVSGIQNWNDFRSERALSSFDSRQRLTVSYVTDLPFGKGKRLLSDVHGISDRLVSGWGINGVSTFQEGFPLGFTATPNQLSGFNYGLRPNVAPGCDAVKTGAAQDRLLQWFNTACFTVPAAYTLGNEGRNDARVRGPGINNFNFAIFKRTSISERFNLEFRSEFFNLFNRVQFGQPNRTVTTSSTSTLGQITSQLNDPRLIQLALRLRY